MSIGVFTDKDHQPTEKEILSAVGPKIHLWETLIEIVRKNYAPQQDLKYLYGKKYGWAVRFRIKEKTLLSLYPAQPGFTVQINLRPGAVRKALGMGMGKNVVDTIAKAHPYPEGRWLFIHVVSKKDVVDIQRMLPLRVGP